MKLSRIAQLCAIVLCIGALPGCGGDKKEKKDRYRDDRYSDRREMNSKKENRSNKKSMNKENN
jgi:hypothetical protein